MKTIPVSANAYSALMKLKFPKESFSDVILRLSKDKIGATAKFFGGLPMDEHELVRWKEHIENHRKEIDHEFTRRQGKI